MLTFRFPKLIIGAKFSGLIKSFPTKKKKLWNFTRFACQLRESDSQHLFLN